MASAGRILIIPKGEWLAETEYEMLDLVFHNGRSWLATKISKGIEPSTENAEYWFKMCESVDLTEVHNRLASIENQMLSTLSLDDIDLSGYATKVELANYATKSELTNYSTKTDLSSNIGTVNNSINGLLGRVGALEPNVASLMSSMASLSNAKFETGTLGSNGTNTSNRKIPCSFAPKLILVIGNATSGNSASMSIIIPDMGVGASVVTSGSASVGIINATRDGNNVILSHTKLPDMAALYACFAPSLAYSYICIG